MKGLAGRLAIAAGLILLSTGAIGGVANLIEKRDQQACRDAGSAVVIDGSGEWHCVMVER